MKLKTAFISVVIGFVFTMIFAVSWIIFGVGYDAELLDIIIPIVASFVANSILSYVTILIGKIIQIKEEEEEKEEY